jgi:hypothetical protein
MMTIWYILRPFGIFCGHLGYFMVIWYIFHPVLVCCTKKNLATLLTTTPALRAVVKSEVVCRIGSWLAPDLLVHTCEEKDSYYRYITPQPKYVKVVYLNHYV